MTTHTTFGLTTISTIKSMTETANSLVKRSYGSDVRARAWYREFREVVLMCLVYNIKRYIKP